MKCKYKYMYIRYYYYCNFSHGEVLLPTSYSMHPKLARALQHICIKSTYSLSTATYIRALLVAQANYGKSAVLLSRYVETFSILYLFIRLASRGEKSHTSIEKRKSRERVTPVEGSLMRIPAITSRR